MNKQAILVIDDEPQIQKLLQINLEGHDFKVLQAATGKEGLVMAANHPPDLIILDLGLPDVSGQVVLQQLRDWYNKPILILSVQNHEGEIVKALDRGASDYLTKPFRTGELLARIRAALRTTHHRDVLPLLHFDDLQVDLVGRVVKRCGITIKLTVTEFQLLALLAKNHERVLTHQFILKEIWGLGFQQETQYLRVFIGALRKKIEVEPHQPKHIITETGVGYRFQ
jgi:two-component system KDP operon response regulator KdpE